MNTDLWVVMFLYPDEQHEVCLVEMEQRGSFLNAIAHQAKETESGWSAVAAEKVGASGVQVTVNRLATKLANKKSRGLRGGP